MYFRPFKREISRGERGRVVKGLSRKEMFLLRKVVEMLLEHGGSLETTCFGKTILQHIAEKMPGFNTNIRYDQKRH